MSMIAMIKSEQDGFVKDFQVNEIIQEHRLEQLLVRCGQCRFICAAQDVHFLTQAIALAGDYVRDISFPAK